MNLRKSLVSIKNVLSLLNVESRESLVALPGIGPKTADKILSLRCACHEQGRRISIRDIVFGVRGLGPGLLAKLCGDDEHTHTVIKYAAFYQQNFQNHHANLQEPRFLLSLDLGILNSAYVLIDSDFNVCDWKRVELGMPTPYSPGKCFTEVEKSLRQFPEADLYILEEQGSRNPSNQGFLNISVELRSLEAMVFAIARLTRQVPVYSLRATRVARYFGINNNKSSVKKKLAVQLVSEMLAPGEPLVTPLGSQVTVPEHFVEYFNGQPKKDDLSDCLLQALAVMDWCKMAREL